MGPTLLLRIFGALCPSRRASSVSARCLAGFLAPVVAMAGTLAACGGNTGLTAPASFENFTRVFSVYALTGTPSTLPAAYSFTSESLARPQLLATGALNFDVAFDLGADGRVRILPARVVVPLPPAGAPAVGVQKTAQTFLAIEKAPITGYQLDSVAVVGVNEALLIEVRSVGCRFNEFFYAKLAIDSIIVAERRIVVRSLINRNCGFRALTEGVPRN